MIREVWVVEHRWDSQNDWCISSCDVHDDRAFAEKELVELNRKFPDRIERRVVRYIPEPAASPVASSGHECVPSVAEITQDAPSCSVCGAQTEYHRTGALSVYHECPSCGSTTKVSHEVPQQAVSPYKGPISQPCSACSAGDSAMEHHDHEYVHSMHRRDRRKGERRTANLPSSHVSRSGENCYMGPNTRTLPDRRTK